MSLVPYAEHRKVKSLHTCEYGYPEMCKRPATHEINMYWCYPYPLFTCEHHARAMGAFDFRSTTIRIFETLE